MIETPLPHAGLTVLDFGHTVMGPTAGLVLADLGAEVIRVEPVSGDPTRSLEGFGRGCFPFYNRNKTSIAIDLKSEAGHAVAKRLIGRADVLIENFGPGTMERLGLGYEALKESFPRLIYLALKGFLPGPYDSRVALDEVVQMMSGLAYMTGPPGQPLRAGASIIDVMGGVMGVVGVQAALAERERTGKGQKVASSLFETAVFLMGQHMACSAVTGEPVPPMPARVSAWAIYDQFDTRDGNRVFFGITSDRHWVRFCDVFGAEDLAADNSLARNSARIEARNWLKPRVADMIAGLTLDELSELALKAQLPFAHIARPEDLFDDPHLLAGDRLLPVDLPDGRRTHLPALPLELEGRKGVTTRMPPAAGGQTRKILEDIGYSASEIEELLVDRAVLAADAGE